jgi:hypothetical protein
MLVSRVPARRYNGCMTDVLQWSVDEPTATAASACYPFDSEKPAEQFQGRFLTTKTWNDRVVQPATWQSGKLLSSPLEIIKHYKDGRYTEAVALVAVWGSMWRTCPGIYGAREPKRIELIERVLRECAEDIQKSRSIAGSWEMLTGGKNGQLGWTSVMTSKSLTFLCRSLGFTKNPPVPIDGALIRQKAWPMFQNAVPISLRPIGDWEGNSFAAYCRYMTAILTWAARKNWTSDQVEATIVDILEPDNQALTNLRCA